MRVLRSLVVLVVIVGFTIGVAPGAVETWPVCADPQQITPLTDIVGAENAVGAAVAWNGEDFGVVWTVGTTLVFQRVHADGTTASLPVVLATDVAHDADQRPAIAWNGTGYGILFLAPVTPAMLHPFFARIAPDGTMIGSRVRLTATVNPTSKDLALTFSGGRYLALWACSATHYLASVRAVIDSDGAVLESDWAVESCDRPQGAWSRAGRQFVVACDVPDAGYTQISTLLIAPDGTVGDSQGLVGSADAQALMPTLADSGGAIGIAWVDWRDNGPPAPNSEIYFALLRPDTGHRASTDVRVTTTPYLSTKPQLVWTGAEFGVFWLEETFGDGLFDVWMQRVSASGSIIGSPVQVTFGRGAASVSAAFANHGYLALVPNPLQAQTLGCATPTVPPCPEGFEAYGVSGTSAIVAWLPVVDPYTDLAYYEVFRDSVLVGATTRPYFDDTGLVPGATYQYNVRAVNAAQYVSGPCPGAQIYVHSSAAIVLGIQKSGSDIALSWNDAGQGSYRVLRGTTPHVMSEIVRTSATTAADRGAAVGGVCYFYSVDTM